MRVRTPSSLFLLTLAALLAACGPEAPSSAQQYAAASAAAAVARAGGQPVTVMSRNLYLGADLGRAVAATTQKDFLDATSTIWAYINVNRFDVRAEGIADEIDATGAELVGLQEAWTWRYRDTGPVPCEAKALTPDSADLASWPDTTVRYDYVQLVLDALAARGLSFRAASTVELTDLQAPIVKTTEPLTFACIRGTDHGVILARDDVQTRGAQAHVYENLLSFTIALAGQPPVQLPVKRGWVSVEAKPHDAPLGAPPREAEWFTFASTHLEAYAAPVREAQAAELRAALVLLRRVILVGDLNSHPGTEGEAVLTAPGGLADVWQLVNSNDSGYTSPYPEILLVPENAPDAVLSERIDYVRVEGRLTPLAAGVVGTTAAERIPLPDDPTQTLWPSDHAGLWATIRLDPARIASNH